jgi:hypothetical protein
MRGPLRSCGGARQAGGQRGSGPRGQPAAARLPRALAGPPSLSLSCQLLGCGARLVTPRPPPASCPASCLLPRAPFLPRGRRRPQDSLHAAVRLMESGGGLGLGLGALAAGARAGERLMSTTTTTHTLMSMA